MAIPNNARNIARQVYRHWLTTACTSLAIGIAWEGTVMVREGMENIVHVHNHITQDSYNVPVAASWSNF